MTAAGHPATGTTRLVRTETTTPALVEVDRAAGDLRRGEPVVVLGPRQTAWLVLAAETALPAALDRLTALAGAPALLLTGRRAATIGLWRAPPEERNATPPDGARVVLATPFDLDAVRPLVDPGPDHRGAPARPVASATPLAVQDVPEREGEAAALALAKLARLLPAVLAAPLPAARMAWLGDWASRESLLTVDGDDVLAYRRIAARALQQVAVADIPLEGAPDCRVHAFRPGDGSLEHLALVIGQPELPPELEGDEPVLIRLHSECFTGDLLGSLRCDCGQQLRGAIDEIARTGSGILLYLAQEGRGIGLINKLRAYALQDAGQDTFDANESLGFEADERLFLPAAAMLRRLGVSRVRLMTNNPDKVEALRRFGLDVVERVAHAFPSNGHNEAYLQAKASRGHLLP